MRRLRTGLAHIFNNVFMCRGQILKSATNGMALATRIPNDRSRTCLERHAQFANRTVARLPAPPSPVQAYGTSLPRPLAPRISGQPGCHSMRVAIYLSGKRHTQLSYNDSAHTPRQCQSSPRMCRMCRWPGMVPRTLGWV